MKFSKEQRKEIINRIELLEEMDLVCQQWSANELRTLIGYWNRHPIPTKVEKRFAVSTIKKIIKNYGIEG